MTSGSRSNRSGGSQMSSKEVPDVSVAESRCSTIGDPACVLDIERVPSLEIVDMIG